MSYNKLDYISRLFQRTSKKRIEHYVISRIWHLLDDYDIKMVPQQYVSREQSKYALTDVYFPQFGFHIEVNEPAHYESEESINRDNERQNEIENKTGHKVFVIDCRKKLEEIGKNNGLFDVIIDDGSHFVDHQLTSFKTLYKYLNNNGLYIIEDLSGSYKKSTNGDPNLSSSKNIIEYFSKHVHSTNSRFLISKMRKKKEYLDISKIFFFEGAVLIQKKLEKKQKSYSKKIAYQKLSTQNRNRKKIKLHNNLIKPIKLKNGLIKFTTNNLGRD